jgi:hypothetical protein
MMGSAARIVQKINDAGLKGILRAHNHQAVLLDESLE